MPSAHSLREYLRRSFQRSPSSLAYIPEIDGLRALAMLLVLGHHVVAIYLNASQRLGPQQLPMDWAKVAPLDPLIPWALDMAFGVPLFCVISGFVLTIPFARRLLAGKSMPSLKLYFLRRLIRLEPPYVFSALVGFALILAPFHPLWWARMMFHIFIGHLLATIVYLHALIYGTPSWVNGVGWTLETEVQFYLVLPLLALIFLLHRPLPRRLLLAAATLAAGLFQQFVLGAPESSKPALTLLALLSFFLAGMLLADLHLAPPRWLQFTKPVGDGLALLFALLIVLTIHKNIWWAWPEPFLIAGFTFCLLRSGLVGPLFASRPMTILGTISYTEYLYHMFILARLIPHTIRLAPQGHALWLDCGVQYLLSLAVVLPLCALLYLIAERPFVEWSHSVTRRLRAPQPPAAPTPA